MKREKPLKSSSLIKKSKVKEKAEKATEANEMRSSIIRIKDVERMPVNDEDFDDLEDIRLAT